MIMEHLCYCSAAFGSWGIVRLGTLVPESHMLFVCPYACGRHNSIGAIRHGYRDRISYLFVDSQDISLGTIEEDLFQAVDRILRELEHCPKVFLIYFSCVLYMIGFDWDAALDELSMRYPDVTFRPCMMNPIAADKKPPVPAMLKTLCSLWDNSGSKTKNVNLLGCYSPLNTMSELPQILQDCGMGGLRHFLDSECFSEYLSMGQSCLNLVVRPEGLLAAKAWSDTIPYLLLPVSYDLETVDAQYEALFHQLGIHADILAYRKKAEAAVAAARRIIGERPIAVDSSAVCTPFALAITLLGYGFNVTDVFADEPVLAEEKVCAASAEKAGVSIHSVSDPASQEKVGQLGNAEIAIGYMAGYYSGAPFAVDLMMDEGMFGYDGIVQLMEKLILAAEKPTALEAMIDSYGLIV